MFQKNAKPNLLEKLIYASGQIGLNAFYTLFSSYVLLYYTDVMGVKASNVGLIILFSKLFDGFSDLIAGQIIDKHKSKYGHCINLCFPCTENNSYTTACIYCLYNGVKTLALRRNL